MTAVTPERGDGLDPELVAGFRQMIQRAPSPATDEVVRLVEQIDALLAIPDESLSRPVPFLARNLLRRARSLLAKLEVRG